MGEAFRLGGWGMYPTLISGILLVGAAARYARQPDRQRMMLVIWMQVLTMLVGTLGFVSGMIKSAVSAGDTAAPVDTLIHGFLSLLLPWTAPARTAAPVDTLIHGFGESLHNVALALVLVVSASIVGALGLTRRKHGARGDGAPIDPFA